MKQIKKQKKPIIDFVNVTKTFLAGKIVANDKVTFSIDEGTIHAIAGENGAGKSTLLSMLFGLYKPTNGQIKVRGKMIAYKSAASAMKDGLGMVQQHFQLVKRFNVGENVLLGNEPSTFGFRTFKSAFEKIDKLSKTYGFGIKSSDKVSQLTVGQEQKTEIMKLLYRDANILIFDEPTAMLTPGEVKEILQIMLDLKKRGKTIIFITHKLDEIKAVADRVSVLRKGSYVGSISARDLTSKKLAKMMVGKDIKTVKREKIKPGSKKLVVKNISVIKNRVKKLDNVSFDVCAGEVVAIAGVEGNGQSQIAGALSGLLKVKTGSIHLNQIDITSKSISFRNQNGVSHIPEDRHKYGMILDLKVYENMVLKDFTKRPLSHMGILNRYQMLKKAREIIAKFDVRGTDGGIALSRGLSGGNQQKAVVGREIYSGGELVIIFQPTRGLDVGAIEYIHQQILQLRSNQKAILLISYDLNEVLSLADRVLVLNSGKITGQVKGKEINKEKIGVLMAATKSVVEVKNV